MRLLSAQKLQNAASLWSFLQLQDSRNCLVVVSRIPKGSLSLFFLRSEMQISRGTSNACSRRLSGIRNTSSGLSYSSTVGIRPLRFMEKRREALRPLCIAPPKRVPAAWPAVGRLRHLFQAVLQTRSLPNSRCTYHTRARFSLASANVDVKFRILRS